MSVVAVSPTLIAGDIDCRRHMSARLESSVSLGTDVAVSLTDVATGDDTTFDDDSMTGEPGKQSMIRLATGLPVADGLRVELVRRLASEGVQN